MPVEDSLTIGQVAQQAKVGVSTVRYYEQKGLIDIPPRNESGYRLYPLQVVTEVRFIKNARDLGFSLRDVADLMRLSRLKLTDCNCQEMRSRLHQQRDEICRQIDALKEKQGKLSYVVNQCPSEGNCDDCSFLSSMLALDEE